MSDSPQVNVSTLSNVITIIEVCSKRGAFEASELELVGKTYNVIKAFVKAVEVQDELKKVEAVLPTVEETKNQIVNNNNRHVL